MSRLDDIMAVVGVPLLLEQLGDGTPITYTPAGGSPVSLTAIVGPERHEPDDDDEEGRSLLRVREVSFATDPAGEYGGVAAPAVNATVTIGGEVWPVKEIVSVGGGLATVRVALRGAVEHSRAGYRR